MRVPLLLLAAVAGALVRLTGQGLPDPVASHFNAAGLANGFMSRAAYMRLTLLVVAVLPLVAGVLPGLLLVAPGAPINLPNAAYCLAPPRRAATVAYLKRQLELLGMLLMLFPAYVHWQVVRANTTQPAMLTGWGLWPGVVVFVVGVFAWIFLLQRHFRVTAAKSEESK